MYFVFKTKTHVKIFCEIDLEESSKMGKKNKNKGSKRPGKSDEGAYVESREFYDGLERDDKDSYEDALDRDMMSKLESLQGRNKRHDVSGGIEEMYALSGDSDSDEDDDQQVEFMDTEQGEENDDDVRAWGKKKKHFYGGNPNDTRREDLEDEELDEAEAEEAESKLLQKKQLENLDDEDFFEVFAPSVEAGSALAHKDDIQLDLGQLSKKERALLFHREAPEFKGLLQDFELKMTEVIEKLQPILTLASEGKIPSSGPAMEYTQTKFKLVLT